MHSIFARLVWPLYIFRLVVGFRILCSETCFHLLLLFFDTLCLTQLLVYSYCQPRRSTANKVRAHPDNSSSSSKECGSQSRRRERGGSPRHSLGGREIKTRVGYGPTTRRRKKDQFMEPTSKWPRISRRNGIRKC